MAHFCVSQKLSGLQNADLSECRLLARFGLIGAGPGTTDTAVPGHSKGLQVDLLRNRQGVINFDAKIPDSALLLGMPQQP